MDDKAVLFKESDIFFFVGEGPAATGANNDFTSSIDYIRRRVLRDKIGGSDTNGSYV